MQWSVTKSNLFNLDEVNMLSFYFNLNTVFYLGTISWLRDLIACVKSKLNDVP